MRQTKPEPRPEHAGAEALDVDLDRSLPGTLPTGLPTAVFCAGSCSHPGAAIRRLTIKLDGTRHEAMQGIPRRGGRDGFWALVPIPERTETGELTLSLEADLDPPASASAPLARIDVVAPPGPARLPRTATSMEPLIAVCMTTCDPDGDLFRTQIESLRAQDDRRWICLISDDCSAPESFDEIAATVAGDERFVLARQERRLGFYRNFERVLRMVPPGIELIALADHDDRWYPDKLAALRDAITGAELAYSDVRRVDRAGRVRAETLWDRRRMNHTNLASLLASNTIPGAACLIRRRAVERALPFPDSPGWDFHDHWLALVALARGDIAYVDRPLYDYVQHPRAVLGRAASQPAFGPEDRGVWAWLARRRGARERWRAAYFTIFLQRRLYASVLLSRCGAELTPRKRRALRLIAGAESSPLALAWLALRPARALAGRNETLGEEAGMARGIIWLHATRLRARLAGRAADDDDSGAPSFDPRPLESRQRRWLAGR